MQPSFLPFWIAATHLSGISLRKIHTCLMHVEDIKQLFDAPVSLLQALGLTTNEIAALQQPDWQQVDKVLQWANEPAHHLITWSDANYPALLREISDPPLLLYVIGDPHILQQPQLAIVGSRNPTPAGL